MTNADLAVSHSLHTSGSAGVAEPGGPGGPWPPQKFEWEGQGMFWPPQKSDHWPSRNGGQIASENPEMCKIFACGGLIGKELIPLMILGCKAEDTDQFPLISNIL